MKLPRTSEPFWWSLFIGGATIAALLVPVHIVLSGSARWLGRAFEYQRLLSLVSHPLSKLYLFGLISLPLFHWAHRFRFTLADLGLKVNKRGLAIACYGSALVGSLLAGLVLLGL